MEDFLQKLQQKIVEFSKGNFKQSWSIRSNVEMYWNPEFRCPYCGGGFPTKRLWMVDNYRQKILGCWYIEDPVIMEGTANDEPKAVLRPVGNSGEEVVHPHADGYGALCMGNAATPFQLLFHGIAPGKHHRHTDAWLLNVGHRCPKLPKSTCKYCNTEFYTIEAHFYGFYKMCSERCTELAASLFCQVCFRPLEADRNPRHENHCPACFAASAYHCNHCGTPTLAKNVRPITHTFYVCPECLEGASGRCTYCQEMETYKVLNLSRGKCRGCEITNCSDCGRVSKRSELNQQGLCSNCYIQGLFSNCYITQRKRDEICNQSTESLLQELEGSATGSSGVSAEITAEPE